MAKASQRSGWRKSKTRPVARTASEFGRQGRPRRTLLFQVSMLVTLAVALIVILGLVLLRTPDHDVPLIVSAVTGAGIRNQDDALFTGPNPYAREDVELLTAWFAGRDGDPQQNVRLIGDLSAAGGAMEYETGSLINAITKPLKTATPGGPDGQMIAIYLSAHGFVDKGTAFLAVGDSRADRESTWIPFQDLFNAVLKTLDDRDDNGKGIRLVMFIDAARVGPQWDWGQFSESFAPACARVSSAHADRVAVILSSSPGQRSWWDPNSGQGLFTKAMVEALTGKRDRDRDGLVSVGEIAGYISARVEQLAAAKWDAIQTPVLIGDNAADWAFIRQPEQVTAPTIPAVDVDELESQFATVDSLWQRHNELSQMTHSPLAFDPLGWSTLEKKLARLDALLLAGDGYRESFRTLLAECKSDLTKFETGPDTLPKNDSLPELTLQDYFHPPAPLSPELTQWSQQWNKKPDVAAAAAMSLNESQAVRVLLPWLQEKNFDNSSLDLAGQLLSTHPLRTTDRPAQLLETHLLRMLNADDLTHVDPATRAFVMDSQHAVRDTLCAKDLRSSFWIRRRLNKINQHRLACIDRMLSHDRDQQSAGRDRWQRFIAPALEGLNKTAARISDAYILRDKMLHAIPRIAETLMSDLAAFENHERLRAIQSRVVLQQAIDSLAELDRHLQLPEDDDRRSLETLETQIVAATVAASNALDNLNKRIIDRLNDATDVKASDARALRQNVALLVGSGTSQAMLRQQVHDRLCRLIEQQPVVPGLNQDWSHDSESADWILDSESMLTDDSKFLQLMSIDDSQAWDHWIRVSSGSEMNQPADESPSADNTDPVATLGLAERFQSSGAGFRSLVADLVKGQLSDQMTADQVMQTPIDQSRQKASVGSIRRDLEHWDTYLRGRTMLFSHTPDPVGRLGRGRFALDQQLFLYDHAARTMDEFWCAATASETRPFFVAAANRLLSSRHQNPLFPQLAMNLDGINLGERLTQGQTCVDETTTLKPYPTADNRDGVLKRFVAGKPVEFKLQRPAFIPTGYLSVWADLSQEAHAVELSEPATESVTVSMTVPQQFSDDSDSLAPSMFFRGLRRHGELKIMQPTDGQKTVFRLPQYGPPTAHVLRDQQEPERLLLVFDCSLSMRQPTSNQLSRLTTARNAVLNFVDGLDPDVEIGLILFGDRYGFVEIESATSNKTVIQPKRENGVDKLQVVKLSGQREVDGGWIRANENVPHNPNFDVHVGLPINPLDTEQKLALKKQLTAMQAIGTTPTYLAIEKAIQQMAGRSGHIIVLTDGKPNVVQTSDAPVDDSRQSAIRAATAQADNVRITIVNYLNQDTQLKKDFPKADVLQAANGQALLRHLQNIRSKPEVYWQRNREPASTRGDFGSQIAISQWPPIGIGVSAGQPVRPAEPFSIRAVVPSSRQPIDQSADVRVEGGEAFELKLASESLLHRPFNYESTQLQMLSTRGSDASRFTVAAGPISTRENRGLTVQLAIESATERRSNGKFTPRPVDIWIELTGMDSRLSSRQSKVTHSFSMPEFQLHQPIPILLCRIDDFSTRLDRVEVRAWLRFQEQTMSGTAIPIGLADAFTSDNLPGVSFHVERSVNDRGGATVTVTEQYSEQRQPGSIRLLASPLPQNASTEVFPQHRVVTRIFQYDDPGVTVTLDACSSDQIQKQSSLYAEGTIDLDFDSR
ncbi:VWA domain-containing protein [Stieleria sp. TO1_6]|uniref:vWA domain-containing protein n=1 Tax=Stieleria tagensis TaxID=2956795 RepID=UPI00209AB426|nr:vWA domain-containing protein [Stieleria tagensis]MCO8120128.1 VWA domain-containing protein [Stieleria tagensis]